MIPLPSEAIQAQFMSNGSYDGYDIRRQSARLFNFVQAQLSTERYGHSGAYVPANIVFEEMERRLGVTS